MTNHLTDDQRMALDALDAAETAQMNAADALGFAAHVGGATDAEREAGRAAYQAASAAVKAARLAWKRAMGHLPGVACPECRTWHETGAEGHIEAACAWARSQNDEPNQDDLDEARYERLSFWSAAE